ncbi:MAG TPA: helix-turn-helix transcriptional regulator [Chitinophagaceae bacterium]|jgi:transcriptional regulator with XRE-family HTH domain|nr:helix-turn-helix transcriptional regulator [Chitinophagaceae bacterium]
MRSEIEQYIIDKVREIRLSKKVSQAAIAYGLGFESTSYIGEIESSKNADAYNIDHLNEIAKILQCSPKDFWPEQPL